MTRRGDYASGSLPLLLKHPPEASAGDLLVAAFHVASTPALTSAGGWTRLARVSNAAGFLSTLELWGKTCGQSEPFEHTFTGDAPSYLYVGVVQVWRGAALTNLTTKGGSLSNPLALPSLTPGEAGRALLFYANASNDTAAFSPSLPARLGVTKQDNTSLGAADAAVAAQQAVPLSVSVTASPVNLLGAALLLKQGEDASLVRLGATLSETAGDLLTGVRAVDLQASESFLSRTLPLGAPHDFYTCFGRKTHTLYPTRKSGADFTDAYSFETKLSRLARTTPARLYGARR